MKNKGITLVSLVVTIIILIILAGVSINLTVGEDGIITMAKRAKENMEIAQIEEETKLNELYAQMESEGIWGELDYDAISKLNDFKKAIADYIEEAGGIKPEYTAEVEEFGESIKGIVKEVTKNATATKEDIAEGKTAWVDGVEITGTSKVSTLEANSARWFYSGNGTSHITVPIDEKWSAVSVLALWVDFLDDSGNAIYTETKNGNVDWYNWRDIDIPSGATQLRLHCQYNGTGGGYGEYKIK